MLAEHASTGSFRIPDAHLLFSGDFQKSGNDLIISDQLHRVVVPDYFHHDKRPLLVSPEGASLDSRVVDALAGHVEYAQAGPAAAAKVIGHVVKMTGSASIVRNGVAIVVNIGDNLSQNDLVQTGSNSTLGLVLDDGTAFNLSANARFMLNELNYDPTSNSNSSLFTLVQGAASFVAGQVAPTGDMKVATPVAVIGIRGTAVLLDINATDGTVDISVADQQDGQVHSVQVFRCAPANIPGVCTAGDPIGVVASNGPSLALTPGPNFQVTIQEISKSPAQVTQEFNAFQQVLSTYDAGKQQFPNLPQHTENNTNPDNGNPNSIHTASGSSSPLTSVSPTFTVFAADVSQGGEGDNGDSASAAGSVGAGSVLPGGINSTPSQSSSSNTNQISFNSCWSGRDGRDHQCGRRPDKPGKPDHPDKPGKPDHHWNGLRHDEWRPRR